MTSPPARLILFLGVATFFEGFDFLAITQVLPELRAEWGLTEAEGGWLVGAANIGPVLAFLLIRQADRVGRSRVLTWTIAGYTLAGLVTAAAPSPWVFAVAQVVARAFLIAEWAVCLVYAAEVYPADRRGRAIGLLQALAALGAVVCAATAPLLLASPLGWRTVYLVGAVPLVLLAFARRAMPESPRFAADRPTQRPLLAILRGPYAPRLWRLAALWFLAYAGTHLSLTFWKEYAVGEAGLTNADVGRTLTIAAVVAMPLVFFTGRLMDSIGRRGAAKIIFTLTALGVFGAFTFRDAAPLTASMILVIFGMSAVLPVLEAFTAELFPTDHRVDAFGWTNNLLGRLANVALPPLAGTLAMEFGWGATVRVTAIFLLAALAGILAWMPETRARELEDTARVS